MGDPAGVGVEITIAAWRQRAALPPFFLIADPDHVQGLSGQQPVEVIDSPAQAIARFPDALPVLALKLAAPVIPGTPEPANAPAINNGAATSNAIIIA